MAKYSPKLAKVSGAVRMCKCDTVDRRGCNLDAVDCLSGGLVHDFNNILTVVIGSVEFLADCLEDRPELRQVASQALAAAEQGAELASRLLSLRRQTPKRQLVDAAELTRSLQPMLRRALRSDIEITADCEAADAWLQVDKAQLTSAVLNLCLNARDAMPKGGRLNLRVERRAAKVLISVEDTGEGMAPEVVSRIFDPYFTTKPEGLGTGLGLSMVHGFVREANGTVEVDSVQEVGTRFSLSLPAAEPPAAAAQCAVPPADVSLKRRPRVAIVEKAPALREHLAQQLGALGCEVRDFASPSAALTFLAAGEPCDVVLAEANAPGRRGRHFAECAWRYRPELSMVLLSDGEDAPGVGRIREDGRVGLLPKPFRRADLARALQDLIEAAPRTAAAAA